MVSDNGTCFVGEVFQMSMSRNGIKPIKVGPKHPASNGLAERAVQSVRGSQSDVTRKPGHQVGEVFVQKPEYTSCDHG